MSTTELKGQVKIDHSRMLAVPQDDDSWNPGDAPCLDVARVRSWSRLYWIWRSEQHLARSGLAHCIVRAPKILGDAVLPTKVVPSVDWKRSIEGVTTRELSEVIADCLKDGTAVGKIFYCAPDREGKGRGGLFDKREA